MDSKVDHMDIDRLSLVELDAILMKYMGYFVGWMYYMVPADATEFLFLDSDSTLLSVVEKLLERTFLLTLYCDHRVEEGHNLLLVEDSNPTVDVPDVEVGETKVEDP